MCLNIAHVPSSIKRIKLTLQPLEEVKASEDYKALHTRLAVETETLHRKWAHDYAHVVDSWNCKALFQRFHTQVCRLLHKAAAGFIAQLGVQNYTASEAIIDFIGTKSNTALQPPLPLDRTNLLQIYKDANNILLLPKPTLVIDEELTSTIEKLRSATMTPPLPLLPAPRRHPRHLQPPAPS